MLHTTHDKESFIFYNDWIATFYRLPPDLRLELMDMIFHYHLVREKQHTDNLALEIAFGMIESTMERDIASYYESKERRRASGAKGGQARASNAKQSQARASNAKQSQAIQAVNVNDNVNVNVNDNVNVNVNDNVNVNEDDVNVILASSPITTEDMLRKYRLTEEQLHHYGELFNEENKGKKYNANDSPMKHFINWLAKRVKKDKEDYGNSRPSYEQRAEGAAQLVAKFLAEGDEVRNEGAIPIDF